MQHSIPLENQLPFDSDVHFRPSLRRPRRPPSQSSICIQIDFLIRFSLWLLLPLRFPLLTTTTPSPPPIPLHTPHASSLTFDLWGNFFYTAMFFNEQSVIDVLHVNLDEPCHSALLYRPICSDTKEAATGQTREGGGVEREGDHQKKQLGSRDKN